MKDQGNDMENLLMDIEKTVHSADVKGLENIFENIDKSGVTCERILNALSAGIEKSRNDLGDNIISIPEFLFSIDTFRRGADLLKEILPDQILPKKTAGCL